MGEPRYVGHVGYCEQHGKRLYSSRKAAKTAIRQHQQPAGMREYRCDMVDGMWHCGHLPPAVMEGRRTARQVYRRRR